MNIMDFKRWPAVDLKRLLTKAGLEHDIIRVRKGEPIVVQGDPADAIFCMGRGKAKVSVLSVQGKEAVIAILGPDEFFGAACLAGQRLQTWSVVAMEDGVVLRITEPAMTHLISTQPEFSAMLIAGLAERVGRVEADLVDQLFNCSEKRLARELLLADFGEEGGSKKIDAGITQEMLAKKIGTTRSRVSYFMNKFRKLGHIVYNDGIHVQRSLFDVVASDRPDVEE